MPGPKLKHAETELEPVGVRLSQKIPSEGKASGWLYQCPQQVTEDVEALVMELCGDRSHETNNDGKKAKAKHPKLKVDAPTGKAQEVPAVRVNRDPQVGIFHPVTLTYCRRDCPYSLHLQVGGDDVGVKYEEIDDGPEAPGSL
ncbi:hypothetical protein E2C01_042618 [Portunus trituberculatus]|uniref:Uncharacterized protein n=1 Tax=Portunus trituberculatus TaxID=210409 RepID=A0A5B7FM95_PORTR|nr:hypothetical protein [Portunus trituberculatus]